jgi:hypothetical protein
MFRNRNPERIINKAARRIFKKQKYLIYERDRKAKKCDFGKLNKHGNFRIAKHTRIKS